MKRPRSITAGIVVLTVLGLASAAAVAQAPGAPVAPVTGAPPPATPPTATPNPDTAVATLLADCVRKEQAREGTTRKEATEACKRRLTTEPPPTAVK